MTAAAAGFAVVLAACGAGSAGFLDDGSGGADEVILRMDIAGGFVPVEYALAHIPTWTLYADGTILVEGPRTMIYPGAAAPAVTARKASPEAVAKLIKAARDAGLEGPDRSYTTGTIADAATTTFTLTVDGETHVTSVYALDFEDPQDVSDDDRAARRRVARLQVQLTDPEDWIPAAELGEEREHEFDAMRVYVQPYSPAPEEDLAQRPKDWPLAEPLATFGEEGDHARCGVVDGADARTVLEAVETANELTPWLSGGSLYRLIFRALLPDETGC